MADHFKMALKLLTLKCVSQSMLPNRQETDYNYLSSIVIFSPYRRIRIKHKDKRRDKTETSVNCCRTKGFTKSELIRSNSTVRCTDKVEGQ